jgi:quercetin dioxygenase-like cupin family protein
MDRRQQNAIDTGVSERSPRPLMAPVLSFDLAAEADELAREPGWTQYGHNARTLIKHSEFRLVLIVMAAGERIEEQTAQERICIQTLSGRLVILAEDQAHELGPCALMAVDRGRCFEVEAKERCSLLLWVGWSR